jgi:flagellar protein FliO/FliZ
MKSFTFTRGVALSVALMLLDAPGALAAGGGESTPLHLNSSSTAHHSSGGGISSGIIRTIVGLLVVIAVIYGVSWILRQFKTGRSRPTGTGLSQVASLPLGNGKSVTLVRAGRELLLLGVSDQSVTKIRSYTPEEAEASGLDPDTDEDDLAGDAEAPLTRAIDSLRRMTVRS